AARPRAPVNNRHMLPADSDHPGPPTRLARGLPGTVLPSLEGSPDRTDPLDPLELTCQDSYLGPPGRKLTQSGGSEGPSGQQDSDSFQGVGLTLSVPSGEEIQPGRRAVRKGAIVTKIE